MRNFRICIIAHNAYGQISGDKSKHIGGVELQTTVMARWLVRQGHKVSLVTWDEGGDDPEILDGVEVIKACRRDKGVRFVRFFFPRWSSLLRSLSRADADIYYHNGAEYVTGQVAIWCKIKKRKFVFSIASDVECYANLPGLTTLRDRWLFKLGLKWADTVIAQTRIQEKLLQNELNVSAQILPMPCYGPGHEIVVSPVKPTKSDLTALFVGRIADVKRVEMLLEVAEKCPKFSFLIVGGGNRDVDYAQRIEGLVASLKNVTMFGRADREQLRQIFDKASILCCTSGHEGFPNTFLEAWSYGLPIVSTVDPDGLISGKRLGKVVSTVTEFVEALSAYTRDDGETWAEHSANARQYYLENHSPDIALSRFVSVFEEALARR